MTYASRAMKQFGVPVLTNAAVSYAIAIVAALIATGLRWLLQPALDGEHAYLFAYPAVLLTAIYGGLGPGIVCAVLTFLPSVYYFEPPVFEWGLATTGSLITAIFVTALILTAAVMQRNARLAAQFAHAQVQDHAQRLEREIAERRRTEDALRGSEERLRLLIESAIDYAIFTIDLNGVVTTWNIGAERLLGYTEQEILHQDGRAIFTPEDRAAGAPERERHRALNTGRSINERWHQRKDGKRVWCSGMVMALRDAAGEVQGFVKIMRDETARRASEVALRDSEERYRRLTELSPDPMVVVQDEHVVYANAAAVALVGVSSLQEFQGRSYRDFISPDSYQAVEERISKLLQSGEPAPRADRQVIRQDGTVVDVESLATPIPWEGRIAVQAILHDVTERKRNEDSLRHANEVHRLLLRELDHRVRNNLASLISLIDITASGKADVRQVSDAIRSRTQAMAAVHQLLSKQHWTTVDFRSLLESLQPAHAPGTMKVQGPKVAIAARQVTAMGMVLQELFSNSVKYGALSVKEGTVLVEWDLRTTLPDGERSLELAWTERGGPAPKNAEPDPGVGTGLIRGFVRSELRGVATLAYPPEGATHHFTFRLDPLPQLASMVA